MQPDLLLTGAVLLLVALLVWKAFGEYPLFPLLTGAIILLLPVVVKANQMIIGADRAFIAERQLYVPAILFCLYVAGLIHGNKQKASRRFAAAGFLVVIPLSAFWHCQTTDAWKDNTSLSKAFMQKFPDSSLTHKKLGGFYFAKGELDAALTEFNAALPLAIKSVEGGKKSKADLGSTLIVNNSRNLFDRLGVAAYQREYADIHYNIGLIYLARKEIDAAMRKFKTTLVLTPGFTQARLALADIYMEKRMFSDASREYKRALNEISMNRN
jgi:Tfp pilus assembly protein PilF